MIEPVLKDTGLLVDVQQARDDYANIHLWWLGQSGFLLQWQGHHVLLDPYLSDSLTRKYAGTEKPHVRMTERPVAPRCLDFIEATTSSHNHTDHLDAATLIPLLEANPRMELIIPEANREVVVDRLQIAAALPIGLDRDQFTRVGPFKFHAVPAAHETIERDSGGRCKFLGYVIEVGGWSVYHSGDTVRYPGMAELLRQWNIDVAILPINGRAPERRVPGNLSGYEAAALAKEIGAGTVIPCHYEMFEFNTVSPEAFVAAARDLGQRHDVLRCGERWSSGRIRQN